LSLCCTCVLSDLEEVQRSLRASPNQCPSSNQPQMGTNVCQQEAQPGPGQPTHLLGPVSISHHILFPQDCCRALLRQTAGTHDLQPNAGQEATLFAEKSPDRPLPSPEDDNLPRHFLPPLPSAPKSWEPVTVGLSSVEAASCNPGSPMACRAAASRKKAALFLGCAPQGQCSRKRSRFPRVLLALVPHML
jgi:hypothetical protein